MAEMTDGGWMAWMHRSPVPGGWPALKRYLEQVREPGCIAQAFMNPGCHLRSEPTFDKQRLPRDEDGNLPGCGGKLDYNYFCSFDEAERICGAFDHVADQGITFDALYFNGYAAYCGVLDVVRNRCRIFGVEGFSGDWQEPCEYLGAYGSALENES